MKTLFSKKDERVKVQRKIGDNEILVRCIFDKNFKSQELLPEKIKADRVFFPNGGGVSLQRNPITSENQCKNIAKRIQGNGREYVGFLIFSKLQFETVIENHKLKPGREDFQAIVKGTPLNEENKEIPEKVEVYLDSKGNPGHADLVYINPACLEDKNETVKTAQRVFARKLLKTSKCILDAEPNSDIISVNFSECI